MPEEMQAISVWLLFGTYRPVPRYAPFGEPLARHLPRPFGSSDAQSGRCTNARTPVSPRNSILSTALPHEEPASFLSIER